MVRGETHRAEGCAEKEPFPWESKAELSQKWKRRSAECRERWGGVGRPKSKERAHDLGETAVGTSLE